MSISAKNKKEITEFFDSKSQPLTNEPNKFKKALRYAAHHAMKIDDWATAQELKTKLETIAMEEEEED